MLLHHPLYFVFLIGVVAIFWLLPRWSWRKHWLLLASYLFYGLFDVRFVSLLFALTVVVFWLGKKIASDHSPQTFAWLSVIFNLGLLAYFKYAGFFMDNLFAILPFIDKAKLTPGLTLLLPIGISFYTFQGISYTTEIYRKRIAPADNFWDFALYLAFFPKLIAGPFVKPGSFFNQLSKPVAPLEQIQLSQAGWLFVTGLLKKVIIADSLASLAETAFRAAGSSGAFLSPLFIQGFYLYAFEIYADFSGYTDLARASALLFGFDLPENFQQPYLSSSVTVFWNRWHMSLTQWFREYLFFPISRAWLSASGRRYARIIQAGATLLTMTLIGIWHGAAWTFVAWGVWQGLLMVIEQLLNLKSSRPALQFLQGLVTFHLIGLGWVLFGSSSLAVAGNFIAGLFAFRSMAWLPYYLPPVLLSGVLLFGLDLAARNFPAFRLNARLNLKPVVSIAVLFAVASLWLLAAARGVDLRPFIYGRF